MVKKRKDITDKEKWRICQECRCFHGCRIRIKKFGMSMCMLSIENKQFDHFFLNKEVKVPEDKQEY